MFARFTDADSKCFRIVQSHRISQAIITEGAEPAASEAAASYTGAAGGAAAAAAADDDAAAGEGDDGLSAAGRR